MSLVVDNNFVCACESRMLNENGFYSAETLARSAYFTTVTAFGAERRWWVYFKWHSSSSFIRSLTNFTENLQAPRFTSQPASANSITSEGRTKILQCQAQGKTFFNKSVHLINKYFLRQPPTRIQMAQRRPPPD